MTKVQKQILCLDFDGVIHSYNSPWKGASEIPDPPVPGAIEFILSAMKSFEVNIYSSRSNQVGGISAMQKYIRNNIMDLGYSEILANTIVNHEIKWPQAKPAAFVTIDDRVVCFTGKFPSIENLLDFKPWNWEERQVAKNSSYTKSNLTSN